MVLFAALRLAPGSSSDPGWKEPGKLLSSQGQLVSLQLKSGVLPSLRVTKTVEAPHGMLWSPSSWLCFCLVGFWFWFCFYSTWKKPISTTLLSKPCERELVLFFSPPVGCLAFGSSTGMSSEMLTGLCKPTFLQFTIKCYDAWLLPSCFYILLQRACIKLMAPSVL